MKKILYIVLILLCFGCKSKTGSNQKENVDSLTTEEYVLQFTKKFIDSTTKAHDNIIQNLEQIFPRWEQTLNQQWESYNTLSTMDMLQAMYSGLELPATLIAWHKYLKEQKGYNISDSLLKSDSIAYRDLIKKYPKHFQNMRLLFAHICKEKFWIDDIEVKLSGNRNQYIHFIGSKFVYNRNIQEFHDNIGSTFYILRFAQVRYSHLSSSGYDYFDIYKGKDSDPFPTILGEGYYSWGAFPNTF